MGDRWRRPRANAGTLQLQRDEEQTAKESEGEEGPVKQGPGHPVSLDYPEGERDLFG